MAHPAQREPAHPVAAAQTFDELAAWVGDEPSGGLAGPAEDTAAFRTARWLLGGVAATGRPMTEDRTRDLAERLLRLADAFD
jgi:hypothetical protein